MPDDAGHVIAPWMQTVSGRALDLLTPTPDQIDLGDIAHALAHINRFSGHTLRPWSVAAHSRLVMRIAGQRTDDPQILLAALLHDAHEAYTGDLTSPMKDALAWIDPGARQTWRLLETRLQVAIHRAVGLPDYLSVDARDAIHHADLCALDAESVLRAPSARPWRAVPRADHPVSLMPLATDQEIKTFLATVEELRKCL